MASVLWGSVIWPTSCRCIHQPPEPHQPARSRAGEDDGQRWIRGREVGERAARDGGRERDDRGVNKQCTVCVCVCVCVCPAGVCAALCHVGIAAGRLASCSSRPISSLTDCPDPPLQSADSGLQHDSYYLTSLSSAVCDDEFHHRLKKT